MMGRIPEDLVGSLGEKLRGKTGKNSWGNTTGKTREGIMSGKKR